MPDPELAELFDKLKTMGGRIGIEIDTVRLAQDMGYASHILTEMGNTSDPEQGLVVLHLLQQLCLSDMSDGMGE